jgi:hypothetical protein
VRVNVKPGLPTAVLVGLMNVSVGVVFGETVIVNGRVFETVKSGFSTNTFSTPTVVRNFASTLAVNCVFETKVVGNDVPFHTTWLVLTKPVPLAVNVIVGLPLNAVFGLIDVSVGGVPVEAPVTVRGS